jgi:hypothetical protein
LIVKRDARSKHLKLRLYSDAVTFFYVMQSCRGLLSGSFRNREETVGDGGVIVGPSGVELNLSSGRSKVRQRIIS